METHIQQQQQQQQQQCAQEGLVLQSSITCEHDGAAVWAESKDHVDAGGSIMHVCSHLRQHVLLATRSQQTASTTP
jgi:hypothetical protein